MHGLHVGAWLNGDFENAVTLQERCYPDELIEMTRMSELWAKRLPAAPAEGTGPKLL
jgi:hypothetical protein